MWAILGMYAVQKTIENNNEKCSDCEEVPDLEVVYTTGRNVGQLRQQLRIVLIRRIIKSFNICHPSINILFTGLLHLSSYFRCWKFSISYNEL